MISKSFLISAIFLMFFNITSLLADHFPNLKREGSILEVDNQTDYDLNFTVKFPRVSLGIDFPAFVDESLHNYIQITAQAPSKEKSDLSFIAEDSLYLFGIPATISATLMITHDDWPEPVAITLQNEIRDDALTVKESYTDLATPLMHQAQEKGDEFTLSIAWNLIWNKDHWKITLTQGQIDTGIIKHDRGYPVYTVSGIQAMRKTLLQLPQESWVLFDLDDTVFVPLPPLLRTINEALLEDYLNELNSVYSNIRELIWDLYNHCEYRLIEDNIRSLIVELKERQIHVLGLTKRRTGYATEKHMEEFMLHEDLTLRQLKNLGIHFSSIFINGALLQKKIELDAQDNHASSRIMSTFDYQDYALLKNGVAFSSQVDKGTIIEVLLQKAQQNKIPLPPSIVLIDDLENNINSVGDKLMLINSSIDYIGVNYKVADKLLDNSRLNYGVITFEINRLYEGKSYIPYLDFLKFYWQGESSYLPFIKLL